MDIAATAVTQSAMHVTNKTSTRGALCKRPTRQGIAGKTPSSVNPRRPHRQRDLDWVVIRWWNSHATFRPRHCGIRVSIPRPGAGEGNAPPTEPARSDVRLYDSATWYTSPLGPSGYWFENGLNWSGKMMDFWPKLILYWFALIAQSIDQLKMIDHWSSFCVILCHFWTLWAINVGHWREWSIIDRSNERSIEKWSIIDRSIDFLKKA